MDKKEMENRLRFVIERIANIPNLTDEQKVDVSYIISDIYEVVWELSKQSEEEATEG